MSIPNPIPEERNRAHAILIEMDKTNANKYKAILEQTLGRQRMIQSLYIRNYVLIDELEMQFSRRFYHHYRGNRGRKINSDGCAFTDSGTAG